MERYLVIDHLKLTYEGLSNAAELFSLIQEWFYEKGWDWHEKTNQEITTPEGKQLHLILEPYKNVSDYYRLMVKITLNISNLKEVEVELDSKTVKSQQGVIRMIIDGYVLSDRKRQWDRRPFYWFLALVLEKYFYRDHFKQFEAWLRDDIDDLYDQIKSYLNAYKYTYQH